MAGLAAGCGTGVEDTICGIRTEQKRGELRGGVLHRHQACSESRQFVHVDGAGQPQRVIVEQARGNLMTGRFELPAIVAARNAPAIHAQPERRPLIVGGEDLRCAVLPVLRQRLHQPRRMRAAYGGIAIDLFAELHTFALAATQDGIDESGGAWLPQIAHGIDGFVHRRVGGDVGVEQLRQADDGECVQFGVECLTRSRQQSLEQRVQTQVPADAVVAERTQQPALLRCAGSIGRQRDIQGSTVESNLRHDVRGPRTNSC